MMNCLLYAFKKLGLKLPKYLFIKIVVYAGKQYFYNEEFIKYININSVFTGSCVTNNSRLIYYALSRNCNIKYWNIYNLAKNNNINAINYIFKNHKKAIIKEFIPSGRPDYMYLYKYMYKKNLYKLLRFTYYYISTDVIANMIVFFIKSKIGYLETIIKALKIKSITVFDVTKKKTCTDTVVNICNNINLKTYAILVIHVKNDKKLLLEVI